MHCLMLFAALSCSPHVCSCVLSKPNHSWPTQVVNNFLLASCMQVLSTQLNQICAMAQLRNRVNQSCLLGCVGGINAGKTSLVRALLGLPQELDGHRRERATRCAAASPMPVPGSQGLQIIQASPLLVDTPGMFDADSTLADCAVRYLGECHQECTCFPSVDVFGTVCASADIKAEQQLSFRTACTPTCTCACRLNGFVHCCPSSIRECAA